MSVLTAALGRPKKIKIKKETSLSPNSFQLFLFFLMYLMPEEGEAAVKKKKKKKKATEPLFTSWANRSFTLILSLSC